MILPWQNLNHDNKTCICWTYVEHLHTFQYTSWQPTIHEVTGQEKLFYNILTN